MPEFRENLPIITGPGAFLVGLIFLALIVTSDHSRGLAFNPIFAVTIAAISIPISIIIVQTYHALFLRFGYFNKEWALKYVRERMDVYKFDAMVDYLSWGRGLGDREWHIIQKRAYQL